MTRLDALRRPSQAGAPHTTATPVAPTRMPSIRPRSLGALRSQLAEIQPRRTGRRPRWWSPADLGTDAR